MNNSKLQESINEHLHKQVTVSGKISHSPNFAEQYAGKKGMLRDFDIDDNDSNIIVLIEIPVFLGKEQKRSVNMVWLDRRDVLELNK